MYMYRCMCICTHIYIYVSIEGRRETQRGHHERRLGSGAVPYTCIQYTSFFDPIGLKSGSCHCGVWRQERLLHHLEPLQSDQAPGL